MVVLGLSDGTFVVFALIAVALVLFVTEVIPNDMTAVGIIVSLALLEPLTGVTPRNAISGFANTATITIVAMYMLSAAIQGTGIVQRLGVYLADFTQGNEKRALAATVVTTGPIAGFINNTPVVAVFIPMISDLAKKSGMSPSKLLLPLSYAAILGGTLTLIGTSTNLLASEFASTLIEDRGPIGMFEFTALGLVILVIGIIYLMTIGWRLTPARIPAEADLVEKFDLEDHLTKLQVRPGSAPEGLTISELEERTEATVRVLQIRREDGTVYVATDTDQRIQDGDVLTVHGSLQAVNQFRENQGLRQLVHEDVTEETFTQAETDGVLEKAVVPEASQFVGETLAEARLKEFHRTTVLAIRREGELIRSGLNEIRLKPGDLLLVQTTPNSTQYFIESGDLVVIDEDAFDRMAEADIDDIAPLSPKTPIAVAIMIGVVATAALGVTPIVIAALGGVFMMVLTGCLSTADAYDAVSWNIIFLLAGVIPLGIALDETGGSEVIAEVLVASDAFLPLLGVLLLFYLVTGLLANVITPVATVVLMIPVAVEAAAELGANEFSFLLAVMFASATSFMTPVGYQTNLMVYGPGGYEFTDFLKVGGPLQFLLAVVTTFGIFQIWGL
ncbi:SLC13 family permease [Natronomonas pharaonis]